MLVDRIIKNKLVLLVLFSTFFIQSHVFASEILFKINTSIKPPFSDQSGNGFLDLLLKELFNRLEIQLEIVRLPAERAMISVNRGLSDGELPRVAGLSKRYKNIIQIPEKIIDYKFVAFSQPEKIENISFEAIKSKRVGIIIGWKVYEKKTTDYSNLMKVAHASLLFKMLNVNHLDVGLYEKYAGLYILRSDGFEGIHECSPPLITEPMYLYINKKHKNKIPKIVTVLKTIKEDGTYDKIFLKSLGPFTVKEN